MALSHCRDIAGPRLRWRHNINPTLLWRLVLDGNRHRFHVTLFTYNSHLTQASSITGDPSEHPGKHDTLNRVGSMLGQRCIQWTNIGSVHRSDRCVHWANIGLYVCDINTQQTRHIDPMLDHRRRRWPNIGLEFGRCLAFAEITLVARCVLLQFLGLQEQASIFCVQNHTWSSKRYYIISLALPLIDL